MDLLVPSALRWWAAIDNTDLISGSREKLQELAEKNP